MVELKMTDEQAGIEVQELLARSMTNRIERNGCSVGIRAEDGTGVLIEALRILDARGLTPLKISVREPSLDDVFLALTGNNHETKGGAS